MSYYCLINFIDHDIFVTLSLTNSLSVLLLRVISCILTTLSTLLFLCWGTLLGARWIFKTVRNNRENIINFYYNAYDLPESSSQKLKESVNKNKFNKSLVIINSYFFINRSEIVPLHNKSKDY